MAAILPTSINTLQILKKRLCLCLFFFLFYLIPLFAQTKFPVHALTEITPPYSVYLSDYTTPGANKLGLNLLLTDNLKFNYQVKLKLIIEGNGITISTSPSYMPAPIFLDGGSPVRFDGYELAAYFNPLNLDFKGISKESFIRTGALPEGIYRIGFQVVDYNLNVPASLTGSSMLWLVLNDPPIINMPEKNVKITATEPQNIMFQWMPRHLGSPNSAFNTEYVFQLFEIWPGGRNPNEIVNSTQPILEKIQTSTTYIYSSTEELALEPGREYAFRVQARDVDGKDLFRNHGYSEVQMFTYGDACGLPTQIEAQAIGTDGIKINWQTTPYNTAFYIQYREANLSGAEWYPKSSYLNYVDVNKLKPNTTYEYQVKGICGTVNSNFSETYTIKTNAKKPTDFACGRVDSAFLRLSREPLTLLRPGDNITSGEFETLVTKVTGGAAGKWSGEGFARIPFMEFVKVRVEFKNITINQNKQVVNGRIVSIYNPSSKFIYHFDEDSLTTTTNPGAYPPAKDTVLVTKIDTVLKDNNGIHVVTDGDTTTIKITPAGTIVINHSGDTTALAEGKSITFKDAAGNVVTVDSKGNITQKHVNSTNVAPVTVVFAPSEDQNFGFDSNGKEQIINGKPYQVAWKSVKLGGSDKANIQLMPADFDFGNIKITNEKGDVRSLEDLKSVKFSAPGDTGIMTATYAKNDTTIIGKLHVVGYQTKPPINVVIVLVNEIKLNGISEGDLKNALNEIYKQACIDFSSVTYVSIEHAYSTSISNIPTFGYNDEMLKLINKAKANGYSNESTFYLFMINGGNALNRGYMPCVNNYGFVFVDKLASDLLVRTIAHELGHGLGLEHIQDNSDNLMVINGSGKRLYKDQWDLIHNPHGSCSGGGAASQNSLLSLINIKLTELRQNLGSNVFAIVHLQDCDQLDVSQVSQIVFSRDLPSGIEHYNEIEPTHAQKIQMGNSKTICTVLYFSSDKNENSIKSLENIASQLLETKAISKTPFLGIYLKEKGVCIDCSEQIGQWSTQICTKEITEELLVSYCKDLFKALTSCSKLINNFSSLNISSEIEQDLIKLYGGELPIDDPIGGRRHDTKARLFITDENSTSLERYFAESYIPKEGEEKIWLRNSPTGWEFNWAPADPEFQAYVREQLKLHPNAIELVIQRIYEYLDATAKGIRKIRIPEYAWNCNDLPHYKPIFADGYNLIIGDNQPWVVSYVNGVALGNLAEGLKNDLPELSTVLKNFGENRVSFAFYSGIYNGLIETFASVPDAGSKIAGALTNRGWDDFEQFLNKLRRFKKENPDGSIACEGIWCAIRTGVKENFNGECRIAETGGEMTFVLLLCWANPAAAEAAFGKGIGTGIKVFKYIDELSSKLDMVGWSLQFTSEMVGVLRNSLGKVYVRIVNGKLEAKAIDKAGNVVNLPKVNIEDAHLGKDANGNLTAEIDGNKYKLVAEGSIKSSLLVKLSDFANLKAWVNSLDEVADANLLTRIDGLESSYFAKLNSDIVHPRYGKDIQSLIKQSPGDLTDVWKRLKDDPAFSWELSKTDPQWEKWSQREFFKEVTAKGKGFETDVCLESFRNKFSADYKVLEKQFDIDFSKKLADYDMYSQVQLKFNGDDYFVADQVFVKYKTIGGQTVAEDILIIENKLSINTPLTTPQSNALKRTSFTVRSQNVPSQFNSGKNLTSGTTLQFSGSKQWYKVHDGEDGKVITGINQM